MRSMTEGVAQILRTVQSKLPQSAEISADSSLGEGAYLETNLIFTLIVFEVEQILHGRFSNIGKCFLG